LKTEKTTVLREEIKKEVLYEEKFFDFWDS